MAKSSFSAVNHAKSDRLLVFNDGVSPCLILGVSAEHKTCPSNSCIANISDPKCPSYPVLKEQHELLSGGDTL